MSQAIKLAAPSDEELISLTEAKQFLRVTGNEENAFIQACVQAATKTAEDFLGRAFLSQGWELWLDSYDIIKASQRCGVVLDVPVIGLIDCEKAIVIPRPPLIEVESVSLFSKDGEE